MAPGPEDGAASHKAHRRPTASLPVYYKIKIMIAISVGKNQKGGVNVLVYDTDRKKKLPALPFSEIDSEFTLSLFFKDEKKYKEFLQAFRHEKNL